MAQDPNAIDDLVSQLVNPVRSLARDKVASPQDLGEATSYGVNPNRSNPNQSSSNPPPRPPSAPQSSPPSKPTPPSNLPGMDSGPKSGQGYQSSVRTMQSDIEAIKNSQSLSGVSVSRPASVPTPVPKSPAFAPPQGPRISDGPMPPPPPAPPTGGPVRPPPPPPPKPFMPERPVSPFPVKPEAKVPQSGSTFAIPNNSGPSSKKPMIMGAIVIVILAVGLGAYFYLANRSGPIVSTTPEPTATPIIAPFESQFGSVTSIVILSTDTNFADSAKTQLASNLNPGQFKAYKVLDEQNNQYDLGEFLSGMGSKGQLAAGISSSNWVIVVYGHYNEAGVGINRPFMVAEISDAVKTQELMSAWELNSNLVKDMAKLFDYEKNLDNTSLASDTYGNVNFKYARLKTRDYGLSYAITGDNLIIASSRDSFRGAVDALFQSLDQ